MTTSSQYNIITSSFTIHSNWLLHRVYVEDERQKARASESMSLRKHEPQKVRLLWIGTSDIGCCMLTRSAAFLSNVCVHIDPTTCQIFSFTSNNIVTLVSFLVFLFFELRLTGENENKHKFSYVHVFGLMIL